MGEKRACFINGAGHGLGVDAFRGEPSHIHLPRRRRRVRADDQRDRTTRGVLAGGERVYGPAQPAAKEA